MQHIKVLWCEQSMWKRYVFRACSFRFHVLHFTIFSLKGLSLLRVCLIHTKEAYAHAHPVVNTITRIEFMFLNVT